MACGINKKRRSQVWWFGISISNPDVHPIECIPLCPIPFSFSIQIGEIVVDRMIEITGHGEIQPAAGCVMPGDGKPVGNDGAGNLHLWRGLLLDELADGHVSLFVKHQRALFDGQNKLPVLIARAWLTGATLTDLLEIAAIDLATPSPAKAGQSPVQGTLFGTAR